MQATVKNIYVESFSSTVPTEVIHEWLITLQEDDGTPMLNLLGAKSSFSMKRAYPNAAKLVEATELDGIIIFDTSAQLRLRLTVSHLAGVVTNLEEQEFLYDWDLTDSVGRKYRLYKGTVIVGGDL